MPLSKKVLVDTTILANVLLKQRAEGVAANLALKVFDRSELPVYAIKEFKRGPLRYFVWLHNVVATTSQWRDAVQRVQSVWMQKNRQATAFQAVVDFESSIGRAMPADIAAKYPGATLGEVMRAEAQLWLKTKIFLAWKKRRVVTTNVVRPLSCYAEGSLRLNDNGTIDDAPLRCGVEDCCLRKFFTDRADEVSRLLEACELLPEKDETKKRKHALRKLHRTPNRELAEKDCFALGDAVFAIQCPKDAVILTTNLVDHTPLAESLGVSAVDPAAVINNPD